MSNQTEFIKTNCDLVQIGYKVTHFNVKTKMWAGLVFSACLNNSYSFTYELG